jgi:hypothetical protein
MAVNSYSAINFENIHINSPDVNIDKLVNNEKLENPDYKKLFDQKFQELKDLEIVKYLHAKEWKQTLINFSKIHLYKNYENIIFANYETKKEVEFELRYRNLLGLYKSLKSMRKIILKNTDKNDLIEKIEKLNQHIVLRQTELHNCYSNCIKNEEFQLILMDDYDSNPSVDYVREERMRRFAWEKVYNKTNKHIIDDEKRISLLDNIVSLWKSSLDEFPLLRCCIYEISIKKDAKEEASCFKEIIKLLKKIAKLRLDNFQYTCIKETATDLSAGNQYEYQIKELYKILSSFYFDDYQETRIFKVFSKSIHYKKISIIDFKDMHATRLLYKLTALEFSQLKDPKLISELSRAIQSLGQSYSKGIFKKELWEKKYKQISMLPCMDHKTKLWELFLKYKKPKNSSDGYLTTIYNGLVSLISLPMHILSMFRSYVVDGHAIWKGKKFEIMLKDMLNWVALNRKSINEKIERDNQDNHIKLKKAVQQFLIFLENMEMEMPKITEDAPPEDREFYNIKVQELYQTCLINLRSLLSMPEFEDDVAHYLSSIGETSGCALFLLEFTEKWFTGKNLIYHIADVISSMIKIGLSLRSQEDSRFLHYLNPDLYANPLDLPSDIIHKAIKKVPLELRTPTFHTIKKKFYNFMDVWDPQMQGIPNMHFLTMKVKFFDGSVREVQGLRFPSPTKDGIITKEFLTFLNAKKSKGENIYGVILQNDTGFESPRTKNIFNLNGPNAIFTVFPVKDNDFANQSGEFADLEDAPAYNSRFTFFGSIMNKFVPDIKKGQINQTGNYKIPTHWDCDAFKDMIEECLLKTSDIFFNNAQSMPAEVRRSFITLFNVLTAFQEMKYAKADIIAWFCNHSADRTGKYWTVMLMILLIALDMENDSIDPNNPNSLTWIQKVKVMIEGGPMFASERGMNECYDGLNDVLKILEKPEARQNIKDNRDFFGIEGLSFPFASKKEENKNPDVKESKSEYQSFNESKSQE